MIQIDMEMPESCPKCKFYQAQHNTEYCIVTGYGLRAEDIFAVTDSVEKAKPYWCPLQEPVKPIMRREMDDICSCIDNVAYCGKCGAPIGRLKQNYCSNCGQAVKWNG